MIAGISFDSKYNNKNSKKQHEQKKSGLLIYIWHLFFFAINRRSYSEANVIDKYVCYCLADNYILHEYIILENSCQTLFVNQI